MKVYEAYTHGQCLEFMVNEEQKFLHLPEHKRPSLSVDKNILTGLYEVWIFS